jgi:5-methylcytosine-specific restriction endonuclease McrBC GTP-binding regulatory subunit McrB
MKNQFRILQISPISTTDMWLVNGLTQLFDDKSIAKQALEDYLNKPVKFNIIDKILGLDKDKRRFVIEEIFVED